MKIHKNTFAAILLFTSGAFAQVLASHAPTFKMPDAAAQTVALHADGRPVVRVNGTVLTDIDLVREMYTIFPYARQHNGVPKAMEADIRDGAYKMIVFEELVYQEAERRHMTIPAAQLDRAVAQFRKQFPTPQVYQQFVKIEFHGNSQLVRQKVERSLLIDKLLQQEVGSKAQVSLAEEKAYYQKHLNLFATPEAFAFQSISLLAPPNATPAQMQEARNRAEAALLKAKQTKSYEEFGMLAEKTSEDDFRVMMGDHKLAARSKLPPVVVNALLAMKVGQVSDVVEFDQGAYTILRLNEHVAAGTRPFDSVEKELHQEMLRNKTEALRRALSMRLSKNAKIEKL
jgi:parvulin-like peptidyl-prolyl isomerase